MTEETPKMTRSARFAIGAPVEHKRFGFKGVVFDVDPAFNNSEEWYQAIPEEARPAKDQPFYHLFAINPETEAPYIAYVSEQNLQSLPSGEKLRHPGIKQLFSGVRDGVYVLKQKGH